MVYTYLQSHDGKLECRGSVGILCVLCERQPRCKPSLCFAQSYGPLHIANVVSVLWSCLPFAETFSDALVRGLSDSFALSTWSGTRARWKNTKVFKKPAFSCTTCNKCTANTAHNQGRLDKIRKMDQDNHCFTVLRKCLKKVFTLSKTPKLI